MGVSWPWGSAKQLRKEADSPIYHHLRPPRLFILGRFFTTCVYPPTNNQNHCFGRAIYTIIMPEKPYVTLWSWQKKTEKNAQITMSFGCRPWRIVIEAHVYSWASMSTPQGGGSSPACLRHLLRNKKHSQALSYRAHVQYLLGRQPCAHPQLRTWIITSIYKNFGRCNGQNSGSPSP